MTPDPELRHFDALIEALVAAGNLPLDGGFVQSQGGWVCRLRSPLDRHVVYAHMSADPHDVVFDASEDAVHCRHCWGVVEGGHT